MKIIQAPEKYKNKFTSDVFCFMAGGMQKSDWQDKVIERLKNNTSNLVLFNPRRDNYDIIQSLMPSGDEGKACNYELKFEQIVWEHNILTNYCTSPKFIFSMYFDNSESPQPICFYELARYSTLMYNCGNCNNCVISVHPEFLKKDEVKIRTLLSTKSAVEVVECTPEQHADRIFLKYKMIMEFVK